jgi:tubulin beta
MPEIVSLHIGKCGNSIASQFWPLIAAEHSISSGDGTLLIEEAEFRRNVHQDVFFHESKPLEFTPRSIFVDFDEEILDNIRSGPSRKFFPPKNFIHGKRGSIGLYGRGLFEYGGEIIDQTMDVIRKATEECESLQGFQITHSLGGGTGSGFTTLVIERLFEQFPDKYLFLLLFHVFNSF